LKEWTRILRTLVFKRRRPAWLELENLDDNHDEKDEGDDDEDVPVAFPVCFFREVMRRHGVPLPLD
jgi:hypothetical protein